MKRLLALFPILAVSVLAGTAAGGELVNLAPFAYVESSAAVDGYRHGAHVNDEDPGTYWSAWPYCIGGKDDLLSLDVGLPWPALISRIEVDAEKLPSKTILLLWENGRWKPSGIAPEKTDKGQIFTWPGPKLISGYRFEYPGVVAESSGIAMHEMRIMGESPAGGERITALDEFAEPDLDWRQLRDGLTVRASTGNAGAVLDGDPDSGWNASEGVAVPWVELSLQKPSAVQRVELDWRGPSYASRSVLELHTPEGKTFYIPRHRFCTSYTLPKPMVVDRVRLYCIMAKKGLDLGEMRLYSGGVPVSLPKQPRVKVWAEASLAIGGKDRTGPDQYSPADAGQEMRISLARNEYEAGQLMVRNEGTEMLRQVSVKVSDLKGPGNAVLQSRGIKWNPIALVNNEYPDVLAAAEPFKVPAGQAVPVWLTVQTRQNAKSGTYRGTVTLTCAGKPLAEFPLVVEVWDFALPKETTYETHYFAIWGRKRFLTEALADEKSHEALIRRTAEDFLSHRVSPGTPLVTDDYEARVASKGWDAYVKEFDRWTRYWLDNGIPFIGVLPGGVSAEGAPKGDDWWKFWQEHLRQNGWLDKFTVRVGDEPPPGNQRVTDAAKHFAEITPDLRRQCAFSSFGKYGMRTWEGLVDEYGIGPRYYGDDRLSDLIDFCHEREKAGDGISWYIHQWLSIEHPAYMPRSYFWYQWKYGINGALLYSVAEWQPEHLDRWGDYFVIAGDRHWSWGTLLWPGKDGYLDSVRWEAIRDGIEDYEMHLVLQKKLDELAKVNPGSPLIEQARKLMLDTDGIFLALDKSDRSKGDGYRIRDIHSDAGPLYCTNADPKDLLGAREKIAAMIAGVDEAMSPTALRPGSPKWAVLYTDGMKCWRDMIYYWIDRQKPDGTFGFGLGEDCEMVIGWPGVMMATDDRRIEQSLARMVDNNWFNPSIQNGFQHAATDPEHGPEPTSYTYPIMLYQQFGSPRQVERCMTTASNLDYWMGKTPRGDWHMKSSYYGSQQMYDWPFYDEDSLMNGRTWIPMIQLALYNRDPYLMKYFLGWADSWVKHSQETAFGKPPGFLFTQVPFRTGEPGGYTKNWWGAGAHEFNSLWYQTRTNEVLVAACAITGNPKYLLPLQGMLDFMSKYAKPVVSEGDPLPPDRFPNQYSLPDGWRDGTVSTTWARDFAFGHYLNWYYYLTGDTKFDKPFGTLLGREIERGPFKTVDMSIVESGWGRARQYHENYFEQVLPKLRVQGDSLANYAAAFWQKQYGSMTFGQRCFRDGGGLANAVNWPWVDFPPPSVVWKNTGYDTGIFVLQDDPQVFRVTLCSLRDKPWKIGAQFFTLDEGTYVFTIGPDRNEDGVMDSVSSKSTVAIERGSTVGITLQPDVNTLVELRRDKSSGPVPKWRSRPDVGLDDWDVMTSKVDPQPGDQVTINVRVHNIGTQPAKNTEVRLLASVNGKITELGKATLPSLNPPAKLVPSYRDVSIKWRVALGVTTIGVSLDPYDRIDELNEFNNKVWVKLSDLKTGQRKKEFIPHPPAKKPSVADLKTEGLAKYVVPSRSGISLDGMVEDAEWSGVPVFDFVSHANGGKPKKDTQMRMAYDDEALYFSFRCEEPDMNLLSTEMTNIHQIYYKDGFEIFLDPGAEIWRYWQNVFTVAEDTFQVQTTNEYAPKRPWFVKTFEGSDFWSAEVKFPFASFDRKKPVTGERWRLNAMRFATTFLDPKDPERRNQERSHFSPLGKLQHHHSPELFGDVYFGKEP